MDDPVNPMNWRILAIALAGLLAGLVIATMLIPIRTQMLQYVWQDLRSGRWEMLLSYSRAPSQAVLLSLPFLIVLSFAAGAFRIGARNQKAVGLIFAVLVAAIYSAALVTAMTQDGYFLRNALRDGAVVFGLLLPVCAFLAIAIQSIIKSRCPRHPRTGSN